MAMVFNATFNNILVISLRLVLLMEETGLHEKTTDKFYHSRLYQVSEIFNYSILWV
jgi:hypothetical protein